MKPIAGPRLRLIERALLDRIAELRQGATAIGRGEEDELRATLEEIRKEIDARRALCAVPGSKEQEGHNFKGDQSCPTCGSPLVSSPRYRGQRGEAQ